jgi:hypothetical protein
MGLFRNIEESGLITDILNKSTGPLKISLLGAFKIKRNKYFK